MVRRAPPSMTRPVFIEGHFLLCSVLPASDGQVVLAAADYLRAYAVDVMMVAFLFCFLGYFNGCGNTKFVMLQGIIGAFGIRIPVSYFMSQIENVSLFGIGLATPASTIVQIILCVTFLRYTLKKEKSVDNRISRM